MRVGVIGAGRRGTTILRLLAGIDGIAINAICDSYAPAINKARMLMADLGVSTADFYGGNDLSFLNISSAIS